MFATPQVTLINTSFFPLNSDHKECISEMYCFLFGFSTPPPGNAANKSKGLTFTCCMEDTIID